MVKWLLTKDAQETHSRLSAVIRAGCRSLADGKLDEYSKLLDCLKQELTLNDE
jgi:hypothetical protein